MDAHNQDVERFPCKNCGRKFIPESLVVHERVCLKSAKKPRKVFDSTKQRVEGTELNIRQVKQAQKKEVAPPKSNWRAQHEDFVNTVRAARGVTIAMKEGRPLPPPPPPSLNPDYIQCPYCDRRFNAKAAERHISFCKETSKRISNKTQPTAAAQARAAARTQFAGPARGKQTRPAPAAQTPSPSGSGPRVSAGGPGASSSRGSRGGRPGYPGRR